MMWFFILLLFCFSFFENRETQIYKNSVSDESGARLFFVAVKDFCNFVSANARINVSVQECSY